jgi:hypothetical protein
MAYRQTKRAHEVRAMQRAAKERHRLEGPPPDYPADLPRKRRTVIIIDYDFGLRIAVMQLYRSSRCDCYDAYTGGKLWKQRIGWSKVLEWIRKAFPRVKSPSNL